MHYRTHTNEQEHCDFFFENMHQESTTNQTRWHANEQKIVVWRCLGAVWRGLGAQRARKPTRMHFRMRKPRSWLTLGGCFLIQFVLFFVFFFVVFSSLRPERYFIDFYAILNTFSTPFLEFFGARWKSLFCNPSKQNHAFQGSRASIFQCFFPIFSTFHSGPHFSGFLNDFRVCLLYTSPSPRDRRGSRMPSSA